MPSAIRAVLLDIEGTTSSISFVHDTMFPYVRQHLRSFLAEHWERPEFHGTLEALAADADQPSVGAWLGPGPKDEQQANVAAHVEVWMDQDRKATGLKRLQGQIWEAGFHSGELIAHVWPEIPETLVRWQAGGLDLRIYSSGSIAAQKLFFGHTAAGNLLGLFSGHYDTTIGGKKSKQSYDAIATDWGISSNQILFISDIIEELTAARAAGFRVAWSVRPGNLAVTDWPTDFACVQVTDFSALNDWLL